MAISIVCAFARFAMNRSAAGSIARSSPPISYHQGIVFQAAAVTSSSSAAFAIGRCVVARTFVTLAGTSAAITALSFDGSIWVQVLWRGLRGRGDDAEGVA